MTMLANAQLHAHYFFGCDSFVLRSWKTLWLSSHPTNGSLNTPLNAEFISSNASSAASVRDAPTIAALTDGVRKSICASRPSRSGWCAINALIITLIDSTIPNKASICNSFGEFSIGGLFMGVNK